MLERMECKAGHTLAGQFTTEIFPEGGLGNSVNHSSNKSITMELNEELEKVVDFNERVFSVWV